MRAGSPDGSLTPATVQTYVAHLACAVFIRVCICCPGATSFWATRVADRLRRISVCTYARASQPPPPERSLAVAAQGEASALGPVPQPALPARLPAAGFAGGPSLPPPPPSRPLPIPNCMHAGTCPGHIQQLASLQAPLPHQRPSGEDVRNKMDVIVSLRRPVMVFRLGMRSHNPCAPCRLRASLTAVACQQSRRQHPRLSQASCCSCAALPAPRAVGTR